jgi:hypothetical protein
VRETDSEGQGALDALTSRFNDILRRSQEEMAEKIVRLQRQLEVAAQAQPIPAVEAPGVLL